jgi:hypothetical protein
MAHAFSQAAATPTLQYANGIQQHGLAAVSTPILPLPVLSQAVKVSSSAALEATAVTSSLW